MEKNRPFLYFISIKILVETVSTFFTLKLCKQPNFILLKQFLNSINRKEIIEINFF